MRLHHPLRRSGLALLAVLCLAAALSACGQKGALYLPADKADHGGPS